MYKSKRWIEMAGRAMRRDGYKCQLSARYGKNVPAEDVHHNYPVDEVPEYTYSRWNLISLSREAPNKLHDRKPGELTEEGRATRRGTKQR